MGGICIDVAYKAPLRRFAAAPVKPALPASRPSIKANAENVQDGFSTVAYTPRPNANERECWYINMGNVTGQFFDPDTMARTSHEPGGVAGPVGGRST